MLRQNAYKYSLKIYSFYFDSFFMEAKMHTSNVIFLIIICLNELVSCLNELHKSFNELRKSFGRL